MAEALKKCYQVLFLYVWYKNMVDFDHYGYTVWAKLLYFNKEKAMFSLYGSQLYLKKTCALKNRSYP